MNTMNNSLVALKCYFAVNVIWKKTSFCRDGFI